MPTSILATKLYVPLPRSKIVLRPRLIEQLNNGLHRRLSLISAPAGFGKTTLVSEWVADCGRPTAWLSIDEGDSDLTRFLTYLISALQTIHAGVGVEAVQGLQTSQSPRHESILISLLNEISKIPNESILVLDDYHLVNSSEVDNALMFLLEHLPPQLHVVITTREDPNLSLARFRVRNQLTELRVTDLRFTPSEAAEFLNLVMGLSLSVEDVAALETRTEGWIAGLQLAALSMKGQEDVHGFIQAFAGDHRYIVDYLVEEVLQRQPEDIRNFLLQTSILDRLNGPLCDAVTFQTEGRAKLESLQRGNLFIIPLDDKRHWYRYHHLFADVLHMHLVTEQPDLVPILHYRASEWYEENNLTADAIHHALTGGNFNRAAELIERALPVMRQSRQEATLLGWLKALPEEMLQNHPVLNVNYAGTLMQNGQFDGVEARLRDIEQWLAAPEDIRIQPVYVNDEDFQRLPSSVAMYQAAIALARGDVANAMKHSRKVLELSRTDDDFPRGAASSLLGLAYWTSGDLETAYQMFNSGMNHLQKVGFISDVIGGSVTLADIRITQGCLREAMGIYERGLQLATKQGEPVLRGAADMHVGLSEIYREQSDLTAAEQHLMKSKQLGVLNGLPKNPYRWRVAMARIRETKSYFDEALELLNEAEPMYVGDFSPNIRPIQALKARVWIKQGELEKALEWASERKLSVEEVPGYLREFEQITFARLLLSKYQSDNIDSAIHDAASFLEHLLKAAEEGGRFGSALEILILQALVHRTLEDTPVALSLLERALKLAEPEGYIRIFVDEGTAMLALLQEAAKKGFMPDYISRLISVFEAEQKGLDVETLPSVAPVSGSLIEALSQRELDILRLFKTELSGPEIASELVIALSTVRTHTKSIYSKLNVNSRRAAVKRAMELGLI